MCGRGAWRVATVGSKGNLGLPVGHLGWYYSTKSCLSVPTCFNEACESILVILGLSGERDEWLACFASFAHGY